MLPSADEWQNCTGQHSCSLVQIQTQVPPAKIEACTPAPYDVTGLKWKRWIKTQDTKGSAGGAGMDCQLPERLHTGTLKLTAQSNKAPTLLLQTTDEVKRVRHHHIDVAGLKMAALEKPGSLPSAEAVIDTQPTQRPSTTQNLLGTRNQVK